MYGSTALSTLATPGAHPPDVPTQLIVLLASTKKPSKHSQVYVASPPAPAAAAVQRVEVSSQPWEPPSQGWWVGTCVGSVVGMCVGASVGAAVAKQLVVLLASTKKPSKHSQVYVYVSPSPAPAAAAVQRVEVSSQPWEPPSQGWSVGACVCVVVGAWVGSVVGVCVGSVVGTWVGVVVGTWVGSAVGAIVATQLVALVLLPVESLASVEVTNPSKHSQVYSAPAPAAAVQRVEVSSQPWEPPSQG
jgi:hypothetical protein